MTPGATTTPTYQLFGARNERNSIRNIEVNVPSREGFKSHGMYLARLRKEGRKASRQAGRQAPKDVGEDRGEASGGEDGGESLPRRWRMHSNEPCDKEQDQCDSQLSLGLRTRFSHAVLTLLRHERHGCKLKTRLVIEKDPDGRATVSRPHTVSQIVCSRGESSTAVIATQKCPGGFRRRIVCACAICTCIAHVKVETSFSNIFTYSREFWIASHSSTA